jgi:hypothetical protein
MRLWQGEISGLIKRPFCEFADLSDGRECFERVKIYNRSKLLNDTDSSLFYKDHKLQA